ncbi:MAG: signal peptidase II [Rhodovibrionaceae bacterium]|nr:signal peptidase II [Rhodovibrionaceae bacterium]
MAETGESPKSAHGRFFSYGLKLAAACFLLDQATKWLILENFSTADRLEVTGFFNLVLVWNRGVSFGLFNNAAASQWQPLVLAALAVVVAVAMGIWLRRVHHRMTALAIGLVIGGALGNAVDRVTLGAVVDFLDFHAFGYHWPAFNVADCGIVVGAVLIAADGLLMNRSGGKTGSSSGEGH